MDFYAFSMDFDGFRLDFADMDGLGHSPLMAAMGRPPPLHSAAGSCISRKCLSRPLTHFLEQAN